MITRRNLLKSVCVPFVLPLYKLSSKEYISSGTTIIHPIISVKIKQCLLKRDRWDVLYRGLEILEMDFITNFPNSIFDRNLLMKALENKVLWYSGEDINIKNKYHKMITTRFIEDCDEVFIVAINKNNQAEFEVRFDYLLESV